MLEKEIALIIFIGCYALALSRKVKIAYVSLISAGLLILFGIVSPELAISKAIKWDVLGIYWGFMMVSIIFSESGIPTLIAYKITKKAKSEKYAIFYLCVITALLSSFMENVGTVLIMAPIAIEIAKHARSKIFPYMVAIAISSNAVTTVTMVADPPSIILAISKGMKFIDFYWFQNKLSIGIISIIGVMVSLFSLLLIFRNMNKKIEVEEKKVKYKITPLLIFIFGVLALAIGPYFNLQPGIIGLAVGFLSLLENKKEWKQMMKDFDWNSFFFIIGIFVVISSLEVTGLLTDFVKWIASMGITNPSIVLAFIIWISVAASAFIDNVPFTVLMIPVCTQLANLLGINPFVLLFGMLIGTGIGGNITPVGATANVFACGIIEKHGEKIKLKDYLKISLPFTCLAVLTAHIILQLIWL
jgi:Na+/H+ antiporter NhaD/arsenite permease-like protein